MAPFSVLCVCMGNICRSPMAERLLVADALALGGDSDRLYVHGAGTGGWHAGEPMDPQAAKQVLARGGDVAGFRARRLLAEHVDASDLILTATIEQVDFVTELRPDAAPRTFVFGEFGRLIRGVELPGALSDVYERGVALVEAADAARAGRRPAPPDELDDPWGRPDSYFSRVADEIHATTKPLAEALFAA
ncbi:phosphotyrosine protein phosphatase [Dactylosporangium sp. NPDC048998]|uniref:arsenate reductase/protein-tyrosine-phosphatase family protein n=1 Tax=Dactylosporangium sp. NPDC048998 TaxID=3363976 RepID=UPI00371AAAAB